MRRVTKLVLGICALHTILDCAMAGYVVTHSLLAHPALGLVFLVVVGLSIFACHVRGCCW